MPDNSSISRLGQWVESDRFQVFVSAVIVLNAIVLGLETSQRAMELAGPVLIAIDRAALGVFVFELAAKLLYRRLAFFRDGWNVFDFVVVGLALIPASGGAGVIRALRVLRVLRLVSVVPQMKTVVQALVSALPGMGSIVAVLGLIFYVGAVMCTKLFGADFPAWFGTVGASMYTLFQVMTLESWSMGIVRPVMERHPQAWALFVPFIVITSFAVLNLFIGVIVDSMQRLHKLETPHQTDPVALVHEEVMALRTELAEIKAILARQTR